MKMRRIEKILAVAMVMLFLGSEFTYANSVSDFFTKSSWSKTIQRNSGKIAAGAAGPIGIGAYYAVKSKQGKSVINWAKKNSRVVGVGRAAGAIAKPWMGARSLTKVGRDVVSSFRHGWENFALETETGQAITPTIIATRSKVGNAFKKTWSVLGGTSLVKIGAAAGASQLIKK